MAFMVFMCWTLADGFGECSPFPPNQKMYTSAEQCKAAIEVDPMVQALRNNHDYITRTFKCMGKPVSLWQPVE
jgi:hypothetical protein